MIIDASIGKVGGGGNPVQVRWMEMANCPVCHDKGWIWVYFTSPLNDVERQPCPKCQ